MRKECGQKPGKGVRKKECRVDGSDNTCKSLGGGPDGDSLSEPVPIIHRANNRFITKRHLVHCSNRRQTINADARVRVNAHDIRLAIDLTWLDANRGVVVDEEAVDPSSIDEDVMGIGDVHAPSRCLVPIKRRVLPLRE